MNRSPHAAVFKKIIVFLMLLAAPLAQARAIDVCDMMGGEVAAEECCCESAHQRMPDRPAPDACCTVSVEFGGQQFAGAAVSSERSAPRDLPHHGGGDAPTFPCIAPAAIVVSNDRGAAVFAPPDVSNRASARSLYLTTARLRL